ncbi:MAG: hypothetical protein COS89_04380 [Deltaproteobacteria bacterium CG07_land_8_20_14_0_80_38_7]|nr:MAG: hypothetical protein COS89_04380 [Deltaproteobacteria bacterium CG07_land_8_20_14_0_80_38_7]
MFEGTENRDREPRMVDYSRHHRSTDNNDGFFCRFTFGQFFALLVLEVFTVFFVFYLGAKYGPKFLGFQNEGPMIVGDSKSVTIPTEADSEIQTMAKDIVDQAKTPELKQRLNEILKRPEERTNSYSSNKDHTNRENSTTEYNIDQPAAVEEQLSTNETQTESLKEPQQVEMRQAEATSSEQGVVRIKSAENTKYSLQIGSYQQVNEANGIVEKWKNKGYPAYLMIADIPDRGRWYRVRIGGFANRDEAHKYKKEFEGLEAVETIVVLNEQ